MWKRGRDCTFNHAHCKTKIETISHITPRTERAIANLIWTIQVACRSIQEGPLVDRNSFITNLDNLTCRRIVEENHPDSILQLLEERPRGAICRYVATVSPTQVNIYDNEDKNTRIGFFAHYVVEKTPFFKGGNCTHACWMYPQPARPRDSVLAVGTSEGEVFLLSCIECRVIDVFSSPSSSPITSVSVSSAHPNLLIAVNSMGTLFVWDVASRELRSKDLVVKDVFCDAPNALLLLKNRVLMLLRLPDFGLSSFASPASGMASGLVSQRLSSQRLCAVVALPETSQWLFLFGQAFVAVSQQTGEATEYALAAPLAEYVDGTRVSLTRDHKEILVSEHSKTRIFSLEGAEIAQLADNYGAGTQNNKDQAAYHKAPITSCVIHPEAKYAVMIESNRVLRFDSIDPANHYVSHVVFPHPVEDMYLFYSSLNSEPLMYLHPKIQTGGKKEM